MMAYVDRIRVTEEVQWMISMLPSWCPSSAEFTLPLFGGRQGAAYLFPPETPTVHQLAGTFSPFSWENTPLGALAPPFRDPTPSLQTFPLLQRDVTRKVGQRPPV